MRRPSPVLMEFEDPEKVRQICSTHFEHPSADTCPMDDSEFWQTVSSIGFQSVDAAKKYVTETLMKDSRVGMVSIEERRVFPDEYAPGLWDSETIKVFYLGTDGTWDETDR